MITEDESWREKFSERNESEGRDGYRPQQYGSENNRTPRYSSQGRVMRPRISRPAFSSNSEGQTSRPYQSREGGYQPRPRYNAEGGYQPRQPREGGYQPRPRYNAGGEGGYQPRPRYNAGGEGGYQQRPRTGGYNRGGYQPRQQGGGFNRRPRTAGYNPNAKYSMKKQIEYKETHVDPDEPIRLNKFLANAGVCSRREADSFIEAGVVKVNGQVVTELGTKIKRSDSVLFHDQLVSIEKKVYILLNKPKDYVTTSDDPQNRKTVMDLVKGACRERIYPVGRLDRNTTGVLLLTNDGELASKLTHPQYMKKKIYHVYLNKNVTAADMRMIADGIQLEDGEIHADAIEYASETDRKQVGIEIHSGRNRIVRRIFESLGYKVIKLDRVFFAGLTKKNVRRGDWRYLTEQEVNMLRMGAFE
ncbi:MAG: RNA-binding S4 domain-containing protein [Bacteroidaceae bacterium]|nr:RNA-binding S4 domain-containing protein [Bacteroidaceae bacterium]